MAGEIAEEELQLFLEPLFKTMATNEKYDAPEWEEIVYTALISAASAGLFEAPGNIAEAVQENKEKKAEKATEEVVAEEIATDAHQPTESVGKTRATPARHRQGAARGNCRQTIIYLVRTVTFHL